MHRRMGQVICTVSVSRFTAGGLQVDVRSFRTKRKQRNSENQEPLADHSTELRIIITDRNVDIPFTSAGDSLLWYDHGSGNITNYEYRYTGLSQYLAASLPLRTYDGANELFHRRNLFNADSSCRYRPSSGVLADRTIHVALGLSVIARYSRLSARLCIVKACPHWLAKQDALYPETGDFVAVFGTLVVLVVTSVT